MHFLILFVKALRYLSRKIIDLKDILILVFQQCIIFGSRLEHFFSISVALFACVYYQLFHIKIGAKLYLTFSPHFLFIVRTFLNSTFVSHVDPLLEYNDLNPLGFFFWQHLRSIVHQTQLIYNNTQPERQNTN
jgi:hypothetical protein